jgi:hypothetical protein
MLEKGSTHVSMLRCFGVSGGAQVARLHDLRRISAAAIGTTPAHRTLGGGVALR